MNSAEQSSSSSSSVLSQLSIALQDARQSYSALASNIAYFETFLQSVRALAHSLNAVVGEVGRTLDIHSKLVVCEKARALFHELSAGELLGVISTAPAALVEHASAVTATKKKTSTTMTTAMGANNSSTVHGIYDDDNVLYSTYASLLTSLCAYISSEATCLVSLAPFPHLLHLHLNNYSPPPPLSSSASTASTLSGSGARGGGGGGATTTIQEPNKPLALGDVWIQCIQSISYQLQPSIETVLPLTTIALAFASTAASTTTTATTKPISFPTSFHHAYSLQQTMRAQRTTTTTTTTTIGPQVVDTEAKQLYLALSKRFEAQVAVSTYQLLEVRGGASKAIPWWGQLLLLSTTASLPSEDSMNCCRHVHVNDGNATIIIKRTLACIWESLLRIDEQVAEAAYSSSSASVASSSLSLPPLLNPASTNTIWSTLAFAPSASSHLCSEAWSSSIQLSNSNNNNNHHHHTATSTASTVRMQSSSNSLQQQQHHHNTSFSSHNSNTIPLAVLLFYRYVLRIQRETHTVSQLVKKLTTRNIHQEGAATNESSFISSGVDASGAVSGGSAVVLSLPSVESITKDCQKSLNVLRWLGGAISKTVWNVLLLLSQSLYSHKNTNASNNDDDDDKNIPAAPQLLSQSFRIWTRALCELLDISSLLLLSPVTVSSTPSTTAPQLKSIQVDLGGISRTTSSNGSADVVKLSLIDLLASHSDLFFSSASPLPGNSENKNLAFFSCFKAALLEELHDIMHNASHLVLTRKRYVVLSSSLPLRPPFPPVSGALHFILRFAAAGGSSTGAGAGTGTTLSSSSSSVAEEKDYLASQLIRECIPNLLAAYCSGASATFDYLTANTANSTAASSYHTRETVGIVGGGQEAVDEFINSTVFPTLTAFLLRSAAFAVSTVSSKSAAVIVEGSTSMMLISMLVGFSLHAHTTVSDMGLRLWAVLLKSTNNSSNRGNSSNNSSSSSPFAVASAMTLTDIITHAEQSAHITTAARVSAFLVPYFPLSVVHKVLLPGIMGVQAIERNNGSSSSRGASGSGSRASSPTASSSSSSPLAAAAPLLDEQTLMFFSSDIHISGICAFLDAMNAEEVLLTHIPIVIPTTTGTTGSGSGAIDSAFVDSISVFSTYIHSLSASAAAILESINVVVLVNSKKTILSGSDDLTTSTTTTTSEDTTTVDTARLRTFEVALILAAKVAASCSRFEKTSKQASSLKSLATLQRLLRSILDSVSLSPPFASSSSMSELTSTFLLQLLLRLSTVLLRLASNCASSSHIEPCSLALQLVCDCMERQFLSVIQAKGISDDGGDDVALLFTMTMEVCQSLSTSASDIWLCIAPHAKEIPALGTLLQPQLLRSVCMLLHASIYLYKRHAMSDSSSSSSLSSSSSGRSIILPSSSAPSLVASAFLYALGLRTASSVLLPILRYQKAKNNQSSSAPSSAPLPPPPSPLLLTETEARASVQRVWGRMKPAVLGNNAISTRTSISVNAEDIEGKEKILQSIASAVSGNTFVKDLEDAVMGGYM